jgi:hypothetical protein
MCRMRVNLFQAKQTAIMARNFLWNERPLDEAQITLLVNALEDMVADIETARRRRLARRLVMRWRVGKTRQR